MTDIYAQLGVARRINAAGTLTRLGGSLMAPEVLDAMRAAARSSVDIGELQSAASDAIARATGAEAGLVTSGAAAALTLAAAACIAGFSAARMAMLPHADGLPRDVLMIRGHRTGYDHAIRAAGARVVDIGHNDRATGAGIRGIEAWEIEAAIGPGTVAFAFTATPETRADLPLVATVCARHGVPVIVDAAAQLPPRDNLRAFLAMGADLVAFSGGKAIGGPQASGILAGRRKLVAAALLQQLDMDVPDHWTPPRIVDPDWLDGVPHHGIGRGFKVGKEEIVGLMVALERFLAGDEAARIASVGARLAAIAAALGGARTRLVDATASGRLPVLEVDIPDAAAASARLIAGSPPVHLSERFAARGILTVDLAAVAPGDDAAIAAALRRVLA